MGGAGADAGEGGVGAGERGVGAGPLQGGEDRAAEEEGGEHGGPFGGCVGPAVSIRLRVRAGCSGLVCLWVQVRWDEGYDPSRLWPQTRIT
ncbi:hypothetical protein GCM10009837_87230 [Streptomyces durmitorensis]